MRYLFTVAAAFVVTGLIFFGMQRLVDEPGGELGARASSPPIEMVRVKRESAPVEKVRELPDKPAMADEPPPPSVSMGQPGAPGLAVSAATGIATPEANVDVRMGSAIDGAPVGDAAASPMVRVNPTMPRKAHIEQVEGVVLVGFDIGPTGSTQNVRVIEEEPPGFGFGGAARRAIERWRYRAKVVDGQPVLQKGLRVRLSFEHAR